MAVFKFSFTGTIEVDEDAVGLCVANAIRPAGGDEKDMDIVMELRLDPAKSLEHYITRAFCEAMMRDFGIEGWRDRGIHSQAMKIQQ